jgi:dienelactone hydrolase
VSAVKRVAARASLLTEPPRAGLDVAALAATWPLLATARRGDGHPVLVLPGLMTGNPATLPLRAALRALGHNVSGWSLGTNRGPTVRVVHQLRAHLDRLHQTSGRRVSLVGWSLGGMFARQLAHRCPDKVRGVVTLGSPFSGDLKTNTNVCEYYERIAGHDVNEPPFPNFTDKPPVPTLALWSRRDGIVAPSAARGRDHERDKAVEVDTYHSGFAVHRPVLSQVVSEIRTFLTEAEGRPPELRPMNAAGRAAKNAKVARTA